MKKSAHIVSSLALVGLLSTLDAQALTLGRLKVLSALGQPLVAEIEVPDISPEEANSLRVGVATPEAFKSAGLDYNAAVTTLNIAGKRRTDGRALLELRSTQAINEPFLDLVLEITWATGRMVRDYTLLLDPPSGSGAPAPLPTPTLPIQSAPSTTATAPIAPPLTTLAPVSAAPISPLPLSPLSKSVRSPNKASPTKAAARTKSGAQQTVAKGDTAAAIAAANKPDGVSLDQMLVAMLRANPQAFVDGNVNRLKTGAVLEMPSAADASAVAKGEAKNNIQVQARDFNDYRRKLAGIASSTTPQTNARKAAGTVTAKVDDKKPSAAAPDRLALSKAITNPANLTKPNESAVEDKIAKDRAAADATARATELQKNITDLNKVADSKSLDVAVGAPAAPASTPAPIPASSEPAATASLPVTAPTPLPIKKSSSFLDQIITHPWALPAGGGLLGLLGLGALLGMRKRRKVAEELEPQNSLNFPATRQPTDTVFGAMGASHLDTQQDAMASTMVYPPSQLSTATGDVDPIAEADVYLAYNRDVQAEEILKEAKTMSPERADIQVKLMEIYAKRKDTEAFDSAAQALHLLTDGAGPHWSRARELARDMGSNHALFNVSASAFAISEAHSGQTAYNNNSLSFAPSTTSLHFQAEPPAPMPAAPAVHTQGGLIDFDLSSLTLDLPAAQPPQLAPQTYTPADDPKLALAEEYLSIGDKAGARALIQDVITHGDPQSLAPAQQMLARLG